MVVLLVHVLGVCGALRWGSVVVGEVGGIGGAFDLGNDGTFHFAVVERVPADGLEKWMCLDKGSPLEISLFDVAEALRGVDCTKSTDDVYCVF